MNKKSAVTLAAGALFAAPAALAQPAGSGIEIYGRFYPQIASAKADGATAPGAAPSDLVTQNTAAQGNHARRTSVDALNSRLGFRGREQLGGGMQAIWQIETRVRFDNPSASDAWANRDSFVGLRGGFGTVMLGNRRTIYRLYGGVVGGFFGVSPGNFVSSSNVLSAIGLDLNDSDFDDTGFHIRAANSIVYETPEFGGFTAGVQYSADERKGNPGRGDRNANLWSFGVKYEAGPLYVGLGHERHNDWFDASANAAAGVANVDEDFEPTVAGTGPQSKDSATRLSVGFAVTPQHRLTADLARLEWKESGQITVGRFERFGKNVWAVGWEARWGGPWRSEIAYVRADEGTCSLSGGVDCSTDGLEGRMVSAGVGYSLSKRTLVHVIASRLTNGASARFDNATNFNPNRGADTTQFAIGMVHSL